MAAVRRSRRLGTAILAMISPKKPRTTRRRAWFLGDAAGPQIEQLLVVETSGGTGVPGARRSRRSRSRVGHRVGPGAVGEHQIAVHPEGVGSGGLGADQHVTDPDRVRVGLLRVRITPAAHPCTTRSTCSSAARDRPADGTRNAGRRRRSTGRAVRRHRRARQKRTVAAIRTTSPPSVTATWRSTASPSPAGRAVRTPARCRRPSRPPRRRSAALASPTTNSTLSA